jgi:hypothetical protein
VVKRIGAYAPDVDANEEHESVCVVVPLSAAIAAYAAICFTLLLTFFIWPSWHVIPVVVQIDEQVNPVVPIVQRVVCAWSGSATFISTSNVMRATAGMTLSRPIAASFAPAAQAASSVTVAALSNNRSALFPSVFVTTVGFGGVCASSGVPSSPLSSKLRVG